MKQQTSTKQILSNLKIDTLNNIQLAVAEAAKDHQNILLLSPTGSGKTIAFLLPVIHLLDKENKDTQALIITPSRELAMQIEKVFKQMATGFKITCCYGGHKREIEENNLKEAPVIIVGTPGRLSDHIKRENINVHAIKSLVLDEFDKTLELGFLEELSFIINSLKNVKNRILTSATNAVEIPSFIEFDNAARLDFVTGGEGNEKLLIQYVKSPEKDKTETLYKLLCAIANKPVIVFCNYRESVERTSNYLKDNGIINEYYHGAMEQQERDSALSKFKNGTANVLVTTDLASRGLDIPHIRNIIHYHLPQTEEMFIHRNGRTARMDASGTAIIILSPEEHLPDYIDKNPDELRVPVTVILPEKPKWSTLFIAAGKKNKVNKIDIVGFLTYRGELKKEDIGLIDVKDFFSFVAIRKTKIGHCLHLIKDEKIKNKKVKMQIAK